jgi:prepilin-type N-terminal cleavage/methylation domain-containing protein
MNKKHKQHGLTLTEMVVVVSIIAVFTVLGLPAIRAFVRSIESGSSARAMISGALASARAIAAKEQHYAGVRFQNKYQQDGKGCQYMIFIVQDFDKTGLANGFRAVEGIEPIKLPDSIGVMDLKVRTNHNPGDSPARDPTDEPIKESYLDDTNPANLDTDGINIYVTDMTSFSLVFSPTGKLVIHDVRMRNRDGEFQPDNSGSKVSMDDIFNSPVNIDNKAGMFIQDDYAELGLGAESSRSNFVIYDKVDFSRMDDKTDRFDYLQSLDKIYINPYTGTTIEK